MGNARPASPNKPFAARWFQLFKMRPSRAKLDPGGDRLPSVRRHEAFAGKARVTERRRLPAQRPDRALAGSGKSVTALSLMRLIERDFDTAGLSAREEIACSEDFTRWPGTVDRIISFSLS